MTLTRLAANSLLWFGFVLFAIAMLGVMKHSPLPGDVVLRSQGAEQSPPTLEDIANSLRRIEEKVDRLQQSEAERHDAVQHDVDDLKALLRRRR